MIDHITLPVSDIEKSTDFYVSSLKPLGYSLTTGAEGRIKKSSGFAINDVEGERDFWIKEDVSVVRGSKYCIAFKADNKEAVDAFYEAALKTGGKDNGKPGYRPKYHDGYYAAFVYDPDGYNIEAVFDDIK